MSIATKLERSEEAFQLCDLDGQKLLKCYSKRIYCTGVKRLAKLGLVSGTPGMAALDMNSAEDAVVNNTREVVPGMVICGMEVNQCSTFGLWPPNLFTFKRVFNEDCQRA